MEKVKYHMIEARTNSEWDDVSFALLRDSISTSSQYKKLRELIKQLDDVDVLSVYDDDVVYFNDSEFFDEHKVNPVIYLTDDEFEKLSRPDQNLRDGKVNFEKDNIMFCSYGKHTGEEFYCRISYEKLGL